MKRILEALDQTFNCLIWIKKDGWGKPDEMLSARAWRLREIYPSFYLWIDFFFFWDKDHCKECYEIELERKQLGREYRNVGD